MAADSCGLLLVPTRRIPVLRDKSDGGFPSPFLVGVVLVRDQANIRRW